MKSSIINHQSSMSKGLFTATVTSNRRIRECFWTMDLEFTGAGAKAFAKFQPGQFVQVDVSPLGLPAGDRIPPQLRDVAKRNILLRRPFSFAEVTAGRDRTMAELLYCMLGPASMRLTTLGRGDTFSLIGPLGRGFSVPPGKRVALLVVGGMGAPPIRCLAKLLRAEHPGINVIAFVGARTAASLPFEGQFDEMPERIDSFIPAFAKFGIPSAVTTDDGSAGRRGFITERLAEWLDEQSAGSQDRTIIYACGPEPMLAATARLAAARGIDCQVSMERRMGCGIGVCQSCAVECRMEGSNETVYKLCCQDGPVFDACEVIFNRETKGSSLTNGTAEEPVTPTEDQRADSDSRSLIRKQCPNLWSLLNGNAQKNPPNGMTEYLQGEDGSTGLSLLRIADTKLAWLFERIAQKQVLDCYGRDLSAVNDEKQLSELLCEIALAAELSKFSTDVPVLRPGNANGRRCDIKVRIAETDVYVECKRLEDRGPRGCRSVAKSSGRKPTNAARPRSMDIASKLHRDAKVYGQFPQGTVNIVFLFHRSWAGDRGSLGHSLKDSALYIHQALFGDKALCDQGNEVHLHEDGLFARQEWKNVSGCIYGEIDSNGKLTIRDCWDNPRAEVGIPKSVWMTIKQQHK